MHHTQTGITQPATHTSTPTLQRILSAAIFALTTLLGVAAFLYPFWIPALAAESSAHSADSPLLLTLIVLVCFGVLLVEVQRHAISAKSIALIGVLVALNSVLRFAEVAIPGPAGFTPIFPIIILGGYIFGARIGFLLGALSLLASALITGGVGPWLPYQMLTAAWAGMTAPLCRPLINGIARLFPARAAWLEVTVLALFSGVWGLIFGAIMNIWFWPYAVGSSQMYWEPGITVWQTLERYAVFYMVTSLFWDAFRAAGNFLLVVVIGAGLLRILRRFQQRFDFEYFPAPHEADPSHSAGRPTHPTRPALEANA